MTRVPLTILVLLIANAVAWGAPAALYVLLFVEQVRSGNGSLFLLLIGPLPYAAGLMISTTGIFVLWKLGELSAAKAMGVAFLVVGLGFAACATLAVGTI